MSDEIVIISKSKLTNIANALRTKLNTNSQYTLDEMVTVINSLEAPQIISVTGISISDIEVPVTQTFPITAVFTPSNATNKGVSWYISDHALLIDSTTTSRCATITQNGRVTGTSTGTCYVKIVTDDGGYTDTCTVTVTPYNGQSTM